MLDINWFTENLQVHFLWGSLDFLLGIWPASIAWLWNMFKGNMFQRKLVDQLRFFSPSSCKRYVCASLQSNRIWLRCQALPSLYFQILLTKFLFSSLQGFSVCLEKWEIFFSLGVSEWSFRCILQGCLKGAPNIENACGEKFPMICKKDILFSPLIISTIYLNLCFSNLWNWYHTLIRKVFNLSFDRFWSLKWSYNVL